jgi:hypothetical protein
MDYVILLHNDEKEWDELPLGGIFVVDCVDRDEAIGWARRFPMTSSDALEIRPAGAHQPG